MPRVIHFEIPADDPQRATEFYSTVFSWHVSKFGSEDYWLATTGPDDQPGINGGIVRRRAPLVGVCNMIDVTSIDEVAGKIIEAGGQLIVPKFEISSLGFVAYFKDTEGNVFGVFEGA